MDLNQVGLNSSVTSGKLDKKDDWDTSELLEESAQPWGTEVVLRTLVWWKSEQARVWIPLFMAGSARLAQRRGISASSQVRLVGGIPEEQ